MRGPWIESADGVFVRRYQFFDQNIVAVVDRGEALVVDTRSTYRQAREVIDDLRALGAPQIAAVVNTHGHYDHAFGNRVFRPAPIWGHERAATMLGPGGGQRELAASNLPGLAAELAEVELDPPDRRFAERADVVVGGRLVHLAFLGRGHTDNDIVLSVEGADVLCAGDLLENGAVPYFGDGFPLDWPATAQAILAMTGDRTVVVPGHGDPVGRAFVERQAGEIERIAALGRAIHAGELDLEAALALAPWSPEESRKPVERAMAQMRGELG
jgi:glyoxylase-like metal-dependent hydrolase (beta-lactamase superfamily II)